MPAQTHGADQDTAVIHHAFEPAHLVTRPVKPCQAHIALINAKFKPVKACALGKLEHFPKTQAIRHRLFVKPKRVLRHNVTSPARSKRWRHVYAGSAYPAAPAASAVIARC